MGVDQMQVLKRKLPVGTPHRPRCNLGLRLYWKPDHENDKQVVIRLLCLSRHLREVFCDLKYTHSAVCSSSPDSSWEWKTHKDFHVLKKKERKTKKLAFSTPLFSQCGVNQVLFRHHGTFVSYQKENREINAVSLRVILCRGIARDHFTWSESSGKQDTVCNLGTQTLAVILNSVLLLPTDFSRTETPPITCQHAHLEGNFLQIGPRLYVECTLKTVLMYYHTPVFSPLLSRVTESSPASSAQAERITIFP